MVKLIIFDGCPNAHKMRSALKESGISFDEINQSNLPEDSPYKNYSSPTILKGDKVIFGSETASGGGCSLLLPSAKELAEALS